MEKERFIYATYADKQTAVDMLDDLFSTGEIVIGESPEIKRERYNGVYVWRIYVSY